MAMMGHLEHRPYRLQNERDQNMIDQFYWTKADNLDNTNTLPCTLSICVRESHSIFMWVSRYFNCILFSSIKILLWVIISNLTDLQPENRLSDCLIFGW